ncbi:MAG: NAD(P)-dependent alcohol dehydrogenase [Microthrixaceae bacterium]
MDAVQLTQWHHEPEVRDVPQPEPGPGQALLRVGGAGMCHSDLHLIHDFDEGMMPFDPPFTLGHENAGWIEALGDGVTGLEVGQPVALYGPTGCGHCRRCLQGMENYCERQAELTSMASGLGEDGGMAQYMLVRNPRHLLPLGDLDPVQAAPLTDAGLTPYHAIKRSLPLLVPGSTAVVIGVGGLGHMGVQILQALTPATIIAVDMRASALDMATSAGAKHGVTSGEGAAAEIAELTREQGADVVLDFVGNDATMQLAGTISRPLGHVTIVGIGGGTFPFSFFSVPYEASVATTYWGTIPELVEVLELAERGLIHTQVEPVSIAEAPEAYKRLARGEVSGRLVVIPD